MRALVSALTLVALLSSMSFAAVTGWVESRNVVVNGQVTPTIDGIAYKDSTTASPFVYFVVSHSYSEAYVGPRYAPMKWIEIGAGLGFESSSSALMKGGYVWLGHSKWSAIGVVERGANLFLKWEANYHVGGPVTVGWWQQSGLGAGPRVQIQVPRLPLTLTAMRLKRGSIITVRVAL